MWLIKHPLALRRNGTRILQTKAEVKAVHQSNRLPTYSGYHLRLVSEDICLLGETNRQAVCNLTLRMRICFCWPLLKSLEPLLLLQHHSASMA